MLHVTSEYMRILIMSLEGKNTKQLESPVNYLWIIWDNTVSPCKLGMGLNCTYMEFQWIPTVVLQEPQLVESTDENLRYRALMIKLYLNFRLQGG